MGAGDAGEVSLGSAHDYSVFSLFHHVHKYVRILLVVGVFAPVSLGIGHGADRDKVIILDVLDELFKSLVVVRAVFLVDLISDDISGVQRVHAGASLDAASRLLIERAQHLHLRYKIVHALMYVVEAVNRPACEMALDRERQIVGLCHGVHMGYEKRMIRYVGDLLPERPYLGFISLMLCR